MYKKNFTLQFVVIVSIIFLLCGCSIGETKLSGEEIFEKLSVSTVEIKAESDYVSSLGTGFYIDDKGTVVTNYHVIEDCSRANVTTSDGGNYKVTNVLGYNKDLDIAILATSKMNSPAVIMSDSVTTGETVYVLGSSLGLTGTFSEGLVSTAERIIENNTYIQISAPISHGNSGGPVVNVKGEVIGIASAGFNDGQNLNLAIPISVLNQISCDEPVSMEEFFELTSPYFYFDGRVVAHGSTLAVRTITFGYGVSAELLILEWKKAGKTEEAMIKLMDEHGADQGGGQLYIIDPGDFIEEIDAWCFDPNRKPGDCAVIENSYGYSVCYISMLNK
jgi:hypothetical protein